MQKPVRYAIVVPAAIAALGGVAVLFLFKDSPDDVGMSLVEDGGINLAQRRRDAEECSGVESSHLNDDYKAYVARHVFRNPRMWIIAIVDFFVYTVRFAALDWGIVLLMETKGLSLASATTL